MVTRMKSLPTQAYLCEILLYNPATGKLTWKRRPAEQFKDTNACNAWNGRFAGTDAGTTHVDSRGRKRRIVTIDWITYKTSRLIWKMVTGNDPTAEIDHKDLDSLNDRWDNLREANGNQNMQNRAMQANNTTGFKGVYRHRDRFQAKISVNGKMYSLGTYDTAEQAHEAYCAVAEEQRGEFFRPE